MERKRRIALMWRWSLVTAAAIALFWTIWYLIFNEVPSTQSIFISLFSSESIRLPSEVSRWWDILIGPIWSSIFILLVLREYGADVKALLAISLGSSLLSGILFGLVEGLFFLGFYLALALILGFLLVALVVVFALVILFTDFLPNTIWPKVKKWLLAK